MKARDFLEAINKRGVQKIAGVPDSTLKQFCDELQFQGDVFSHDVTANEGAAVGIAVGSFLGSGKPACVYMQNSGLGNIVNPLTSLANIDVYGIPMLFVIGWRGEPGVKDEPQHVFQGKITCEMLEVLQVPYTVIDDQTTLEELEQILDKAWDSFAQNNQYAIVVKKGTFAKDREHVWENGFALNREEALGTILESIPSDACIVSTTGKISRELYEQSDARKGNHDNLFMSVGGMGHASMIALGVAGEQKDRKVICVDGDGATLMHMGSLAFVASQAPENFYHVVINNQAHESVGAMPTGCMNIPIAEVARTVGYKYTTRITTMEQLKEIQQVIETQSGPCLFEVMVGLDSRADLGRPKESARENKESFMEYLKKDRK